MKTVPLKCNLIAACAYVLHAREKTEQFHFYVKGKFERRKICSLILHGSSAGSEIKSFPWSSAPENSGRAGLREGGRSVVLKLIACLSSLFPLVDILLF